MTNMKRVNGALGAYSRKLDEASLARLTFFKGLWDEQALLAERFPIDYAVPDEGELKRLSTRQTPVLQAHPAAVEGEALASCASSLASALIEQAGFEEGVRRRLAGVDWNQACIPFARLAGQDPQAGLEAMLGILASGGLEETTLQAATSALSLGLRALLDPVAQAVLKARDDAGLDSVHPVRCPVCGCSATLAVVSASTTTSGGARQLYCGQCGAAWNFDRIRCPRCGTRNQGHLHYHHVDGDEAHRLYTCDECGGYIRTAFQEDILMPISFEVEDVVMARLDLVARSMQRGDEGA